MNRKTDTQATPDWEKDFNGAALIDAQGREIPITEDMVQQACAHLERAWHYPATATQQRQAG
ncbi:hypothetical protein S7S_07505 [Isoalcanivorax pacificus W11-5]|uniref:Uncharacterized protein n=1 Tax=Isoalcanivorax pacificus W11-5 TaxID=391936 RepID=A0A0B4XNQ0_9GAMM|nr:PA1571 family protein [Isoalcanivorax pacificus]AJD47917.1 hypothetical protein S7S_07505 [Isoalcanivorax pacificus W11-5]